MSHFQVSFTKIKEINKHENADALDIATVYGFNVVTKKGQYNVGDFALYIPIDSVLDPLLESCIFGEDSKIKLHHHRVKQIRIRKYPSQGMLVDVSTIKKYLELKGLKSGMEFKLEHDYSEMLNVRKYEPPVPEFQQTQGQSKTRNKPLENSLFHKYNGVENIKWFPELFKEDEEVIIQEKLHGTNVRFGILPTEANTLLKKIKKFFGLLPEFERVYGSNNVELTNRSGYKGFYGEDIYGKTLNKFNVFEKLIPTEVVYGEIIGEGIQKNYHYGHKGEHHLVIFDVKVLSEDGSFVWLSPEEVEHFALQRGFSFVPVLYRGKFNKQLAHELTSGDSVYCPQQKVREGIVIKSRFGYNNTNCSSNKKALKWISEKYLDADNDDFH